MDIINATNNKAIVDMVYDFCENLMDKQGLVSDPSDFAIMLVKQTGHYHSISNSQTGQEYFCQWSRTKKRANVYTPIDLSGKPLPKEAVLEVVEQSMIKAMDAWTKTEAYTYIRNVVVMLLSTNGVRISNKADAEMRNYEECGRDGWDVAMYGAPISTRGLISCIFNTLEVTPA